MMAKKNNPYFDDFITMTNFSVEAAEYLQLVFNDFKPGNLPEQRKKMHEIEHAADKVRHAMMRRLSKEFVTPVDREDIIQLANALDSVTDRIDDILIRMYMYNIDSMEADAQHFVDVIVRCCKSLHKAMVEFPNFQKSKKLFEAIIEINSTEEDGDAIYIEAVHKLYKSGAAPMVVAVWSDLYDRLEDCCDACEDAADLIEIIAMKNS